MKVYTPVQCRVPFSACPRNQKYGGSTSLGQAQQPGPDHCTPASGHTACHSCILARGIGSMLSSCHRACGQTRRVVSHCTRSCPQPGHRPGRLLPSVRAMHSGGGAGGAGAGTSASVSGVKASAAATSAQRRPWSSVKGVIMDMDGTLTLHGAIDFARMKRRVGIPRDMDVLSAISKMDAEAAARATAIVEEEERLGLQNVRTWLNPRARG